MAEYIERNVFLKRIKPYDTSDKTDKALYNFAFNKMMSTPNADVVPKDFHEKSLQIEVNKRLELERKINKAIEEIKNYAEFHNGNLYRGKRNYDIEQGRYLAYKKSLEILKRNIGE